MKNTVPTGEELAYAINQLETAVRLLTGLMTTTTDQVQAAVDEYPIGGRHDLVSKLRLGGPELWARPDVRKALANRDMSTVFKRMQMYGISQRRIAAAVGCSQSEVSEIIGGRKVVSVSVLERFAIGLRVPLAWVGLGHDVETAKMLSETT